MQESNKHHIDEQYKQHFHNVEISMEDSELLWDNINKSNNGRRNPFFLWRWLLPFVLFFISIFIYLQFSNTNTIRSESHLKNSSFDTTKILNHKLSNERNNTSSKTKENTIITQNNLNKTSSSKTKNKQSSTKTALKKKNPNTNHLLKNDVRTRNYTKNTFSNQGIEPIRNSSKITFKSNLIKRKELKDNVDYSKPFNPNNLVKSTTKENNTFIKNSLNTIPKNTIINNKKLEDINQKKEANTKIKYPSTKNTPAPITSNLTPIRSLDFTFFPELQKPNPKVLIPPISKKGFFVKLYGETSLPFESISISEPESNYAHNWKEQFEPFLSHGGGIQIGYQFSWNGYLSTGIAYQHFQTKHFKKNSLIEENRIWSDQAYYSNINGSILWFADSITQITIKNQTHTLANNHKLWHIPIQLGYINTYNDKYRVGINVEILANISKQYDGYLLQKDNHVILINEQNTEAFMSTNVGLSFSTGLHMGYLVNKHWEIYLNPNYRVNRQSYLQKSTNVNLNYNFLNIRAGINYRF